MQTFILRFAESECGTTVIEYALVAALISVTCIGSITAVSITLSANYNAISTIVAAAI
jgi:Flp pilus assembly pilin Flp